MLLDNLLNAFDLVVDLSLRGKNKACLGDIIGMHV